MRGRAQSNDVWKYFNSAVELIDSLVANCNFNGHETESPVPNW